MVTYPTSEINFSKMFKLSFRQYFRTFLYSFFCIALLFLSILANKFFIQHFNNVYALWTVKILFWAFSLFFFSVALLATHNAFNTSNFSATKGNYRNAFKKTCDRLPKIAGTFVLYVLGIVLMIYAAHFVRIGILHMDPNASNTIKGLLLLIEIVFFSVFLCMFFFSYPLSIINEKSVMKSFFEGAVLSEKNKIGILLLIFIVTLPASFLRTEGLDIYFIATYHLNLLYDFLVLCFFTPLFINLLLLMMNDAKNQLNAEDE